MRSWKMNILVAAVGLSFACDNGDAKEQQPKAAPAATAATPKTTPATAQTANLPVVQYYALPG